MWIIGAASDKQIKRIQDQGWDMVQRVIKPDEFNKFVDPKCETPAEPDSKDLVMVYIDKDIASQLDEWCK